MRRFLLGVVVGGLLFTFTAEPAFGEEVENLDQWMQEWVSQADIGLTDQLLAELQQLKERHPWYFQPRGDDSDVDVQHWRPLVAAYWPADTVDQALCLLGLESGGDPNADNPDSTARGLFQILASLWAPHFGVSPNDLFDPVVNVKLARQIYDLQGWDAWSPYLRGFCQENT